MRKLPDQTQPTHDANPSSKPDSFVGKTPKTREVNLLEMPASHDGQVRNLVKILWTFNITIVFDNTIVILTETKIVEPEVLQPLDSRVYEVLQPLDSRVSTGDALP